MNLVMRRVAGRGQSKDEEPRSWPRSTWLFGTFNTTLATLLQVRSARALTQVGGPAIAKKRTRAMPFGGRAFLVRYSHLCLPVVLEGSPWFSIVFIVELKVLLL